MSGNPFSRIRTPGSSYAHLWWLNPIWPFALMLLSTGLAAYIIPESDYVDLWKTPKYLGLPDLQFIVFSVGGFVLYACFVNLVSGPYAASFTDNIRNNPRMPWEIYWLAFYVCFALTVMAYFLWLALSVVIAHLSLGDVIASMHNDPDAVYVIRDKTDTVPGITTLTQLEMGLCLLGTLLGFRFGWKKNFWRLVPPMAFVFVLAALRAHFRDERVALLEMIIPMAILSIALVETPRWPRYVRRLLACAPFVAPLGLYIFFSAAEYSRSWVNYYQGRSESSFLWFSFTRLAGYYVTALNNGAAFVQTIGQYAVPFHSMEWFWKFPLIKEYFKYKTLSNAEPWDDYKDLLKQKLNPELNNPSGIFVIQLDYGYLGGIGVWCFFGAVAMLLYRSFMKGSLTGLFLYPFFYIGLLESPRILYWTGARAFPTWMMLLALIGIGIVAANGQWQKRVRLIGTSSDVTPTRLRPLLARRPGYRRRFQRVL
jgi:hypothetical protein